MLFTTVAQMKEFGLLNKNMSWDSISPYVQQAELVYLIPILGQVQYDTLNVSFNAGTLTQQETDLLKQTRYLLYNATLYEALPHLAIYLSELGVQVNQSKEGTSLPAPKWSYQGARYQYGKMATQYAEALYTFLQDRQNDYPEWQSSSSYSYHNALLLRNNEELSRYLNTHSSVRLYVLLRPFIENAMLRWVNEIVPTTQTDALLNAMRNDALTTTDEELLDKIRRVLAWGAYHDAIPFLNVRVDGTSIHVAMMSDDMHENEKKNAEECRLLLFHSKENAQMYRAHLKSYMEQQGTMPINTTAPCFVNTYGGAFSV